MSAFAAIGVYNRESDWLIALAGIVVVYLIFYPCYILFLRYRHMRRIKKQLVTSMYKLPVRMTPVELAYIFSTKVKRPQMYATLLDLANRSIVILHNKFGQISAEMGPKVDNDLNSFELLLVYQIKVSQIPVNEKIILDGVANYDLAKGTISGSRQYVFWWLLRDTLRKRKIILDNLSKRYAMMLITFGVLVNFAVCVLSVFTVRLVQMISSGEVDLSRMTDSLEAAAGIWVLSIVPMLVVSFGLLKYRGKMLGRDWIMTPKYRRYLAQMDAFREFVRLTHRDKLHFESKELKAESVAHTRPYAIACGYIKK